MSKGITISRSMTYTYDSSNGLLSSRTMPGGKMVQYTYDAYGTILSKTGTGAYTYDSLTTRYWYINGPDGLIGIYIEEQTPNGTVSIPTVAATDHLGSIEGLFGNNNYCYYAASYDEWGDRDVMLLYGLSHGFDRGYTGHEHIDGLGLINMNGRMYDPLLGRFLSPDPYVQAPSDPQNYNRYSYCLNNPLKYTDTSGEFFTALTVFCPALLPIGIAMDIGWMQGAHKASYYPNVSTFDGACRGALSGAIGGALSMVGGGTLLANVLWGGAEGAITGAIDAALWGEDINRAALNGVIMGTSFALLSSQNLRNFVRGKGFYNNERVFENFRNGKYMIPDDVDWRQACLDFFSFRGTYAPSISSHVFQGESFYGVTKHKTGDISYGDLAFDNYPTLYGTYIKESYHSNKVLNGILLVLCNI